MAKYVIKDQRSRADEIEKFSFNILVGDGAVRLEVYEPKNHRFHDHKYGPVYIGSGRLRHQQTLSLIVPLDQYGYFIFEQ